MEGEAQASLHRSAAVCATVDAAAEPLSLGSVEAGVAAGNPAGQVSGHVAPVEVLCDLSLADSLASVTLVVMELLQDRVYLGSKGSMEKLYGVQVIHSFSIYMGENPALYCPVSYLYMCPFILTCKYNYCIVI